MEINKHIQLLQRVYAGVLADAVLQLGKEGLLEKVTERKRDEQLKTGKQKAAQFQITTPESVFTNLSELFGCADWKIIPRETGFLAENRGCMLAYRKQTILPWGQAFSVRLQIPAGLAERLWLYISGSLGLERPQGGYQFT